MQFGNGAVAQLARAIGSYPIGREFESLRRYQYVIKVNLIVRFFCISGKYIYVIIKQFVLLNH